MAYQTVFLECPGCGARIRPEQTECDFCHGPIIVSSFNTVDSIPAPRLSRYAKAYESKAGELPGDGQVSLGLGLIYLKLSQYEKAMSAFDAAITEDFNNSEAYFYAAVSTMKGRKPFVLMRPEIDKVVTYLNDAVMLEPRGIYYYFLAYIKYDYFSRKFLRNPPDYRELLATAKRFGYSPYDVRQLFDMLKQDRPAALQ